MSPGARPGSVMDLSALTDPVRRRLYEYVAGQEAPVRRDSAAAAAGISRTLAAYHLDRLVEAGLLSPSYARPSGATGPGAGRPAKQYRATHAEVAVTVPPRSYDVLAAVLAEVLAVELAQDTSTSTATREALLAAAESAGGAAVGGHAVGQPVGDEAAGALLDELHERGYEPVAADGAVHLCNCPFRLVAQRYTELVCGLNHSLLRGLLVALGQDPARARLTPRPGRCCVTIDDSRRAAGDGPPLSSDRTLAPAPSE